MSALRELRAHLDFFSGRCLAGRWFGARLHVGVAYSAEQADREADKIISGCLADGVVTVEEVAKMKTALRMIRRSAEQDRKLCELARV